MPHLPSTFVHELVPPTRTMLGTPGPGGTATTFAFGADNRLLALGGSHSDIELWDAVAGRQVGSLGGRKAGMPHATAHSLAFSPDGQLLASGCKDKAVRLWSAANGECVSVLEGFSGAVRQLAFNPAARMLAAADENAVLLFDPASGAATPVRLPDSGINSVAFSPDGALLAVAAGGTSKRGAHRVTLVDPRSGQPVRSIDDPEFPALSLAFSPDGRALALVPRSRMGVQLWDTRSWQLLRTLKAPSIYFANQVAFSSQGALGASLGEKTCLWDPATEAEATILKSTSTLRTEQAGMLAFSPDGRLLAACRFGSHVRIYR